MEAKIKYIKPEVVSFGYNLETCILAGSGQIVVIPLIIACITKVSPCAVAVSVENPVT